MSAHKESAWIKVRVGGAPSILVPSVFILEPRQLVMVAALSSFLSQGSWGTRGDGRRQTVWATSQWPWSKSWRILHHASGSLSCWILCLLDWCDFHLLLLSWTLTRRLCFSTQRLVLVIFKIRTAVTEEHAHVHWLVIPESPLECFLFFNDLSFSAGEVFADLFLLPDSFYMIDWVRQCHSACSGLPSLLEISFPRH